jgi:hypothetical protein
MTFPTTPKIYLFRVHRHVKLRLLKRLHLSAVASVAICLSWCSACNRIIRLAPCRSRFGGPTHWKRAGFIWQHILGSGPKAEGCPMSTRAFAPHCTAKPGMEGACMHASPLPHACSRGWRREPYSTVCPPRTPTFPNTPNRVQAKRKTTAARRPPAARGWATGYHKRKLTAPQTKSKVRPLFGERGHGPACGPYADVEGMQTTVRVRARGCKARKSCRVFGSDCVAYYEASATCMACRHGVRWWLAHVRFGQMYRVLFSEQIYFWGCGSFLEITFQGFMRARRECGCVRARKHALLPQSPG